MADLVLYEKQGKIAAIKLNKPPVNTYDRDLMRALDLMITGRLITADEALELGLVDRVFDATELMDRTMEYAEQLAGGATRAVTLIKRAVQEGLEMPLNAGLALERELQNRLFVTRDAQEGLSAFVEKRKPEFAGE